MTINVGHDVLFLPPNLGVWSLADEADHTYWKEAIYAGDFELPSGESITIDLEMLQHWDQVTNKMLANGIKIPLPIGHTTDPDKNRGDVIAARVGVNQSGLPSLYLKTKFHDAQKAEASKHSQVSIFSPPEFVDGKGNRYVRPITHLAITDYPVIPGLQGFQSIAASFVPSKKEADMPLKALAARLNLQCENDEQLEETIVASFSTLNTTVSERDQALAQKDEEIAALRAKVPGDPLTVSASHLSMLKDNREMKLSRLVDEAKISPAVKEGLVDIFCSPTQLTLSLSSEQGDGGLFAKVVDILNKNEVVSLGDTDTVVSLGKDINDPEKNPLLADARRRAEAAKR